MGASDDELLRRPIMVLGAPRSGTTMLDHFLSQHPSLARVTEPRLIWRWGNDGKSDMLRPDDARPEVRAHIRRRFAAAVREQGRQRLLEKTPSTALRMGFVDRIFPDARFVHIIRHGVDSILAIHHYWTHHARGIQLEMLGKRIREIRLRQVPHYAGELVRRLLPQSRSRPVIWGPRLPGIEEMARDLETVEVCALQWRLSVEAACRFGRKLPPERYLECRIEEMSPALIDRILSFCELDDGEPVRAFFRQRFRPDDPGRRRREAEPDFIRRIEESIEPTLAWLGYR